MRPATLPKAVRAIVEVLLVNRFQPHRHRSLDDFVLERRLPNRTRLSVLLLDPDAFHGRCLGASAVQSLVQVVQVLVKVFGILLRRHSIDPRGTGLARVAVRLPQKVYSDQVSQRRKNAIGIAGGLRRNPLEFWWD